MPKSMTGYGKSVYTDDNYKVVVEIKTVNSRYLEFINKIPRSLNYFEDNIRKAINDKVKRGRVETYIQIDSYFKDASYVIDEKMALAYKNIFADIQEKLGIEDDMKMSSYINLPNIMTRNENVSEEIQVIILDTLNQALDNLVTMRTTEGDKIVEDLHSRIDLLQTMIDELEDYTADIVETVFAKLQKKIEDLTSNLGVEVDSAKVIEQAAFYADKMNVTEEIVRFRSHINQLKDFMRVNDGEIGKKIDFLLQEMNREINTIGSKSQKSEIVKLVVDLKSELEKIREQIQNIE